MRYLLEVSYDGAGFCGWQKQKKDSSVQEEIEKALKILLKQDVNVVGSGRTDAGVSAIKQVAHFDCENKIENLNKFLYSLNGILTKEIRVLTIVETELHARFSAKRKTYVYNMYKSNIELPLKFKSLRIDKDADIVKMQEFAKLLVGQHDFKNFCASNSEVESTIRTIYSIKIKEKQEDVVFEITGNGFLYKMVRNIVGLLLYAIQKDLTKEQFLSYAFGENSAKKTAPAFALMLKCVKY